MSTSDSSSHAAPQGNSPATDAAKRQRDAVEASLTAAPARSQGRLTTAAGESLAYSVCAAFVPVMGAAGSASAGQADAAIFTTAYTLDGATHAQRPVCFVFNGGPGSSSVWLHLGAVGPKRVRVPDDGNMPAPPYAVDDNPHSWLSGMDLVFIDPPHTGYSITASDDARKKMLSVDGDIAALVEVIQAWLTRHQRWGSPVYLCGESYGTTRVAGMADKLIDDGVGLSGLLLISLAMDIQALEFTPRNDLPYGLYLPAMAGVAQYHGMLRGPLAASPEAAREAAQSFVTEDYLAALHLGARLDERSRLKVQRRLSELTGLPSSLVAQKNMRITDSTFFAELLRPQGHLVGRLDARSTAPMALPQEATMGFDPGMEAINAPFTMAGLQHFGQDLGFQSSRRYMIFNPAVNSEWNWNRGTAQGNSYACTSPDLARALRRQPHLRVFVASGLYDLGTPYSASDWALDQLDIPASVRPRIEHHHYAAGHMMYSRQADLESLKSDVDAWLASTPAPGSVPAV